MRMIVMKIVETIKEVREQVKTWRKEGLTVGLVPTMGYLHEGHKSLIDRAVAENDRVDNIGFGRMMISGKNPNYEPWFLTKIIDYEEKDRYGKGYQFISMRPFTIISGAKQGYAQNEYQLYFVKPRSTMKWKYQGATSVKYLFSMFSTASN